MGLERLFPFPLLMNDIRLLNVSGELLAAMYVMKYAVDHGIPECSFTMIIWELKCGLPKDGNGMNALTQQYAAFYDSIKIVCAYTFTRWQLIRAIHIMKWLMH